MTEYQAQWRKESPDKAKAISSRYYQKNRDRLLAASRERNQSIEWKEYQSKHYSENKEDILSKQRDRYSKDESMRKRKAATLQQRRKDRSEWLKNYKENQSCFVCGESDSACLEFHHKDPSQKEELVSRLINQAASMKMVLNEIEKCVILCANCHRKLHADRFSLWLG